MNYPKYYHQMNKTGVDPEDRRMMWKNINELSRINII